MLKMELRLNYHKGTYMKRILCFLFLYSVLNLSGDDLSETETVLMMLENNADVQNSEIDVLAAREEHKKAVSMFMPVFSLNSTRVLDENYTQNMTTGTLSKLFSTGTSISVSGGMTDLDFDNAFIPDKENQAGLITVRQSLLQDSFGRASRRVTAMARMGIDVADLGSRYLKEEMIQRTVDLYWVYVLLTETVKAEQERHQYYKDLYELVMKKRGFGAAEKRDLLITKAALLQSENSLRDAEYRRQNMEMKLRLLISPDKNISINPLYTREDLGAELPVPSEDEDVAELIMNRTDMRLITTQLEIMSMSSEMYTSRSLPQLDFILGYGTDGIDMLQQGYVSPDPLDPAYMVGLSFRYQFGGSRNSSDARISYLETVKLRNQYRLKRQEAVTGYLDSVRRYKTALEMYETAAEILKVSREKIENEMTELKNGRSTSETVVEFENMYIAARLSFYSVLGDLRRAGAQLRKQMGTLVRFYTEKGVISDEEVY